MAITFFASRTLARNAAKELNNGKVKDFGSDADAGKRWAVEYTSKSDAVKIISAGSDVVVDVAKVVPEAGDLIDIPSIDAVLVLEDVDSITENKPVYYPNMYGKPVIMRTVKTKSPVEVRTKRSRTSLINNALKEAFANL